MKKRNRHIMKLLHRYKGYMLLAHNCNRNCNRNCNLSCVQTVRTLLMTCKVTGLVTGSYSLLVTSKPASIKALKARLQKLQIIQHIPLFKFWRVILWV
jgi:hypothetical protein